jgi:hypothetical protein
VDEHDDRDRCRQLYRRFGEDEARGSSARYEVLSLGVADDPDLVSRLLSLDPPRRQPNLLLAANQFLDGPTATWAEFRAHVLDQWDSVAAVMSTRTTQTNEPARCTALVAALAGIDAPIALVELGSSAGLCLIPDRYAYDFGDGELGASTLRLDARCHGAMPAVRSTPDIGWRQGIDLAPLDVTSEDDVAWLLACIWPEHDARRERLRAACAIARVDPPPIARGDILDLTSQVLATVPAGLVTVVWHSAVLGYLPEEGRAEIATLLEASDAIWISAEGPSVVTGPAPTTLLPPPGVSTPNVFVLRHGRDALALADPHGSWLRWLDR